MNNKKPIGGIGGGIVAAAANSKIKNSCCINVSGKL